MFILNNVKVFETDSHSFLHHYRLIATLQSPIDCLPRHPQLARRELLTSPLSSSLQKGGTPATRSYSLEQKTAHVNEHYSEAPRALISMSVCGLSNHFEQRKLGKWRRKCMRKRKRRNGVHEEIFTPYTIGCRIFTFKMLYMKIRTE